MKFVYEVGSHAFPFSVRGWAPLGYLSNMASQRTPEQSGEDENSNLVHSIIQHSKNTLMEHRSD